MTPAPGTPITELDTPALIVDLDAMNANIAACFDGLEGTNVRVRPHLKTGKSPIIAHRLLQAGAIGVCVAKLGEAEVMAGAGIDDILITTELVGARKLERLVALLRDHPHVKIVLDSLEGATTIARAVSSAGLSVDALIDVNVGQNRCGVLPENAVLLAAEIGALEGVRIVGLQGYEGHLQHDRDLEVRRASCDAAMVKLTQVVTDLERAGFAISIVSTGGTGTYAFCARHERVTEVQPGSFIFMDTDYIATPGLPFKSALTVHATVISTPGPGRAILDAGFKSLSTDSGFAQPADLEGWSYSPAGDEHGALTVDADAQRVSSLKIGDRVALIPSHIDTTVNLHNAYFAHRSGVLEAVWPISARGKIQ
jgi:D-serine deaminase-like pyridoxal phosphate-dependent protein